MKRWFTSDHHFDHKNILTYDKRPFATVDEMNEDMVRRWNERVAPGDVVYYLGDFSLSKRPVIEILPKLNGTKHLIAGNHDHCHPAWARNEPRIERMRQFYLNSGFASIKLEDEVTLGGRTFKMCHLPYVGDHPGLSDRYITWRPKDEGAWLLHGHVHGTWKHRGRMVNVGVVHWEYAPVSEDEILKFIECQE